MALEKLGEQTTLTVPNLQSPRPLSWAYSWNLPLDLVTGMQVKLTHLERGNQKRNLGEIKKCSPG